MDGNMSRKTEESRIAYNTIAFTYDMSREGRYTGFHRKELSETIDLNEVITNALPIKKGRYL